MMFHENLTDCKEMMKRIVKELEFYEKYRFEMTLFNDYGSIKELITNLWSDDVTESGTRSREIGPKLFLLKF